MPSGLASSVLAFVLLACANPEALKQRCLEGDTSSCEKACGKDVAAEGGCFQAAEHLRRKAGDQTSGEEWEKAFEYAGRACKAAHAPGCLLAAEMLDAPHVAADLTTGSLPAPISDADMLAREARLKKACDLGLTPACKRLGDAMIGKSRERALAAYQKACDGGPEPAACRAARAGEVEVADRWSLSCRNGGADDCARLGDLLYTVDVPRAFRLFVTECQMRGVEEYAGGMAAFLSERVKRVKPGLALPGPAPAREVPQAMNVEMTLGAISGGVAAVEVERSLALLRDALAVCAGKAAGTLSLRLVVDRTGDVFKAEARDDRLPSAATSCIVSTFEAVAFTAPATGLANVDVTLKIAAPPGAEGP